MIPTTLGIAVVIFGVYHAAPGDPATVMMGDQSSGDGGADGDAEGRIEAFRRKHGLDRSLFVQFCAYIGPFNPGPDGHPWFTSPRTERKVVVVEVVAEGAAAGSEGAPARRVEEGVPVAIEHLYETPQPERAALDAAVQALVDDRAGEERWAAAQATLVGAGFRRAAPPLFTALHARRLAARAERAAIARVCAALSELAERSGELHGLPEPAPATDDGEGERQLLRRWFGWYYTHGGARTQNTGERPWGGLLALDLGREMQSGAPVARELGARLAVTVPLSLASVLLSYLLALPLGVFSARRQGRALDGAVTTGLFLLYSVPTFWAGLMLSLLFGQTGLEWLPVIGLYDKDFATFTAWQKVVDVALHAVLPVLTLTYGSLAYLSRQMRAGLLEVIRQDYIRTARAKGLSEDRVVYKHALRNAVLPILTLLASILPVLIGGSVIVEQVFDLPGMGSYAFEGLLRRDFSIVMATTLLVGVMTQLGILLSDVLYSIVDPRIRLA